MASIEINSGNSGTPYAKFIRDAAKLNEVGKLRGFPHLAKVIKLSPAEGFGPTIGTDLWVTRQHFSGPPLQLIFAESLRGNLGELITRIANYNKTVDLSSSVDGAFVLNKGFILHLQ